jgi:hypothetical protein
MCIACLLSLIEGNITKHFAEERLGINDFNFKSEGCPLI